MGVNTQILPDSADSAKLAVHAAVAASFNPQATIKSEFVHTA
jgi:hypothetical protein